MKIKFSVISFTLVVFSNICFAQWVKTAGPLEVAATSIEQYHNSLFLGTQQSGIFKSTNNATSWTRVNSFPDSAAAGINKVIDHGDTLFVSTSISIYKSDDSGTSWHYATTGIPDTMYNFSIYEGNNTLYATALALDWNTSIVFTRLYYYSDVSQQWSEIGNLPTDPIITSLAPLNDTIYIAVSGHGILKTHNYGSNWDSINVTLGQINTNSVSLLASNGQALFAIATSTSTELLSSPNGVNWSSVPITVLAYNTVTSLSARNDTIVLGSPGAITISYNGGTSWNFLSSPYYYNFFDVKFVGNTIFAADNTSGVMMSTNTTDWTMANNGIPYSTIYNLANPFGNIYAMNSFNTYSSSNSGTVWTIDTSVIFNMHAMARTGNKLSAFVGSAQQNVISLDQGQTWRYDTGTGVSMVVNNTLVDNEHRKIYAFNQNDVRRSDDYGASWKSLFYADAVNSHDTTFTGLTRIKGRLFLTIIDTALKLLYSDDSGDSWQLNTSVTAPSIALAVDTTLVVGNSTGIIKSNNLGNSFTVATTSAQLFFAFVNGKTIFNYGGIYPYSIKYSPDYGTSWIDISDASLQQIKNLAIDNSYLYAGTQANGVWRRHLSDIGITYTPDTTNNYILGSPIVSIENAGRNEMKVYPNPFNTKTTIELSTTESHTINIRLYDALGHCVQTIARDKFPAGKHTFELHTELATGIYFAIANIDGYTITTKIIKQ